MVKFSANLGFLWAGLPLPDAIRAAAQAGFDAVECHWPYDTDAGDIRAALARAGLLMLGLNTVRGGAGAFGLSALPGQQAHACAAIDQALDYAQAIDAAHVHVMAGVADGDAARAVFIDNLRYACDRASGRIIVIEPINTYDVPGYFLNSTAQALEIITQVARPNLRLMFDCYHIARQEGDVLARLDACLPLIGHIQFAGVPDRGEPDRGDLDYSTVFAHLMRLGYDAPLGAEYHPRAAVGDGLGWMRKLGRV